MKNIGVLLVVVSAVMVSGCGSSTPVAATPPVATATALTLTAGTSFMLSGHTETFIATATISSGGTQVVTPAWSVDNAGVLSIDAAGRATARATGTSNCRDLSRTTGHSSGPCGAGLSGALDRNLSRHRLQRERRLPAGLVLQPVPQPDPADHADPVTESRSGDRHHRAVQQPRPGTCRDRWPATAHSCCPACSRERSP